MTKLWLFLKQIISSKYLSFLLRYYLGFLFITGGISKISYPSDFAETLVSYQIVPYWSVNFFAIALPWVELVCGVLLIIGLRTRAVAVIISILLVTFATGLLINLIRGAAIYCGCFSNAGDRISWWDVPRDLLWVLFAIQIFFFDRKFLGFAQK
jgi:uncharacterized membrane protein YphA (DoxX/SURF4 family)